MGKKVIDFASLDPEQDKVLTKVLRVGKKSKVPKKRKALLSAVETAIVESGIRNLSGGDADSAGWRQERGMYYDNPTNVKAAAKRYFQEVKSEGNLSGSAGELAQSVQQSAFPERYDEHKSEAQKLLKEFNKKGKKAKGQTASKKKALSLQQTQPQSKTKQPTEVATKSVSPELQSQKDLATLDFIQKDKKSPLDYASFQATIDSLQTPTVKKPELPTSQGKKAPQSKGVTTGKELGSFSSTAYGPPWNSLEGGPQTATGKKLKKGKHVVAVDPDVIPLGTKLYIWPNPYNYKGVWKAEDTGGAIQGNDIDFFVGEGGKKRDNWGVQNVNVSIAKGGGGKGGQGKALPGENIAPQGSGQASGRINGKTAPKLKAKPEKAVVQIGKLAQAMGLYVGENPHFGGVEPVHVTGSYHYQDRAIDVSGDPGLMAKFAKKLDKIYGPKLTELFWNGQGAVNRKFGERVAPGYVSGHTDHVHVAV